MFDFINYKRHEDGQEAVDALHDSEHYSSSKRVKVLVHMDLFLATCAAIVPGRLSGALL